MTNNNSGTGSIDKIRKQVHATHELISTAYHEAGHTIYGLLHYMKIESVYVYENKKSKRFEGFTHYNVPNKSSIEDTKLFSSLLKNEISLRYAGLVAEKYHFKKISGSDKFPMFFRDGSADDTSAAAELIRQHNIVAPGRKRYAYKKKLLTEISHELQCNWDAVTVIAHALFQKRKLSCDDIKEILIKKTDNCSFWKEQYKNIDYIYNNIEAINESTLKNIFNI